MGNRLEKQVRPPGDPNRRLFDVETRILIIVVAQLFILALVIGFFARMRGC